MMTTVELDTELRSILEVVTSYPPRAVAGRGRSRRPGANSLRRMTVGRLVREYRTEYVQQYRSPRPSYKWESYAREPERRDLAESARFVREADKRDMTATVAAGVAAGVTGELVIEALEKARGEDQELARLEQMIDQWAEQMGVAELPAAIERETTVLSTSELRADLEEIGARDEVLSTVDFVAATVGDNPQEAIDFVPPAPMRSEALEDQEQLTDTRTDTQSAGLHL